MKRYLGLVGLCLLASLLVACGEENGDNNINDKDAKDSASDVTDSDTNDSDSSVDSEPDTGSKSNYVVNNVASDAGKACAQLECEADIDAGMAAMKRGDLKAAYESFKCGDTTEAAAGAALSRLALLAEHENVRLILLELGVTATDFPASDLFGPNGLFANFGKLYDARGQFGIVSDAVNLQYPIGSGRARIDNDWDGEVWNYLKGSHYGRDEYGSFYLDISTPAGLTAGTEIQISEACEGDSAKVSTNIDTIYLDTWLEPGSQVYECNIRRHREPTADCQSQVGTITVRQWGADKQPVRIELTEVPVICSREGDGLGMAGGGYSETYFQASLSGSLTTTLYEDPDWIWEDLHPLISEAEEQFDRVPADLTLNDISSLLSPLAQEIDEIACYASRATNGASGPVFVYPVELTGHKEIPLMSRDTKAIASAAHLLAAAFHMVASYDLPMTVGNMDVLTDAQLVEEINAHLGELKVDNYMALARTALTNALTEAIAAMNYREDMGMLAANAYNLKSEEMIITFLEAALDSLENGLRDAPYAPKGNIQANLKVIFDSPPNPATMSADPVVLETSSFDGAYVETVEVFFQELLEEIFPNFDYDNEYYDYENELNTLEDSIEELELSLCSHVDC